MTESTPATLAQAQQLNRGLTEKVLDLAASDPQWRQQLIDDPEAAMQAAGFPETQQIQQMQAARASQGDEVVGQQANPGLVPGPDQFPGGYYWACSYWTLYWQQVPYGPYYGP